jgi:hypothetical protein
MNNEQAQEHYDRFLRNSRLAEKIETQLEENADWACVTRFYAALHLITAYLGKKSNVHFRPDASGHGDRKRAMRSCPELREAPQRYQELKDLSESVRYDPGFVYAEAHHKSARTCLTKITNIIEPKLKRMLGH